MQPSVPLHNVVTVMGWGAAAASSPKRFKPPKPTDDCSGRLRIAVSITDFNTARIEVRGTSSTDGDGDTNTSSSERSAWLQLSPGSSCESSRSKLLLPLRTTWSKGKGQIPWKTRLPGDLRQQCIGRVWALAIQINTNTLLYWHVVCSKTFPFQCQTYNILAPKDYRRNILLIPDPSLIGPFWATLWNSKSRCQSLAGCQENPGTHPWWQATTWQAERVWRKKHAAALRFASQPLILDS